MKQVFALLLLLLSTPFTKSALAATSISAAVLKCPAIPEEYSRMLMELGALKTTIKSSANCKPVLSEVQSLESLLNERRTEILAIVKKSETEALSTEEQDKIRIYAQDVTNKVFNTIELLNRNNYCFSEDKQKFNFSSLASITLDATAILKNFGGAWSTPIALGGQVLAGIFQSINQLVNNQVGYDFDKIEQRENFVRSLCTYYNYRQDVENLLYPEKRLEQLEALRSGLNNHMSGLSQNCPQCKQMIQLDKQLVRLGTNQSSLLFTQMNVLLESADKEFNQPLGSLTATALTSSDWLENEIKQIQISSQDFNVGRDLISEMRSDLDAFLFEKQSPAFIYWQAQKSTNLLSEFSNYTRGEGTMLIRMVMQVMKNNNIDLYQMNEGKIVDFLTTARAQVAQLGEEELAFRIDAFRKKSISIYDSTIVSYNVMATYCNFFKHAGVYNRSLQNACDGGATLNLRAGLNKIRIDSRKYNLNMITFAKRQYSTDWAETLNSVIHQINTDPNSYIRKQ